MSQLTQSRRTSPWAIILIAIGVIWLLSEANIFTAANLSVLFRFWPLILIAFGVELLLGRNNQRLSLLIIGGTVLVMIALMLVGPSVGLAQTSDVKTATYSTPLDGVESARVNISANVASVRVVPISNPDNLIDADIEYVGDLTYDASTDGAQGVVNLESQGSVTYSNIFFFDWLGGDALNGVQWDIGLNPAIPLDLNVSSGTGGMNLDLSTFQLTDLRVNGGTGSVDLVLPSMTDAYTVRVETGTGAGHIRVLDDASVRLVLQSGTGSMTIDVPDDAAVRLEASVGTGSVNVPGSFTRTSGEDGFIGDSGTWETANFDAAAQQITIEYDGGTGSLNIQ